MKKARLVFCFALLGVAGFTSGCKSRTVDKIAFKSAINNYLGAHQECIWSDPRRFPVQADTSSDEQTKGYDALTDAGLLARSSAEKKRFLIGSKQVNVYDLSDKGRSSWTADQTQPGYGNFCFGHRQATSIDSFDPPSDTEASQYVVNYHYDVASPAGWASSAEMRSAFPKISTDMSGQQTATATLIKAGNGWQVANNTSGDSRPVLPQ